MTSSRPARTGLVDLLRRLVRERVGGEPARILFVDSWRGGLGVVAGLVFADGSRPALAFKAATRPNLEGPIATERDNLERLARSCDPSLARSVPRLVAFERDAGQTLLLETAVEGRPVAVTYRGRDPGGWLSGVLEGVTEWLAGFHRGVGGEPVPLEGEVFDRLVLEPFEDYLRLFTTEPAERTFLEATRRAAERLRGASLPVVPQHGDFCAANVFLGGAAPVEVIDWEEPFRPSLPLMDLFHFVSSAGLSDRSELERDGLKLFEAVFLEETVLRTALRRALRKAVRPYSLTDADYRVLAVRYWVSYALEKVAALRAAGVLAKDRSGRVPSDPDASVLNAFSSARFAGGACLNLRLMAAREEEFSRL